MDFEMRKDRGPQGRKRLTRERASYFQPVQQGDSSREACRIVGIDRRTGKKRWGPSTYCPARAMAEDMRFEFVRGPNTLSNGPSGCSQRARSALPWGTAAGPTIFECRRTAVNATRTATAGSATVR